MDNMKEIDLEKLKGISGGQLKDYTIEFLNDCIAKAKKMGLTAEELLEGTTDPEMQEYVRTHW